MRYRAAVLGDAAGIARLHAASWREFYRGALRDEFLDGDIEAERTGIWIGRLKASPTEQFVFVAENDERIVGFVCAFGGQDPVWGTLIDNLHVNSACHGEGIGARLMREAAAWSTAKYPDCGLYLWVFEQNAQAQVFYKRFGAKDVGGDVMAPPGGGSVPRRRYSWSKEQAARIAAAGRSQRRSGLP